MPPHDEEARTLLAKAVAARHDVPGCAFQQTFQAMLE
jgi:hypothetical protein